MSTEEKQKPAKQEIDGTSVAARAVRIVLGVLVVIVLIIGGFIAWKLNHPQEEAVQHSIEDRIGVVDMQKLIKNHGDYEKLLKLKQEAKALEADLSVEHMEMNFTPPEPDKEAFDKAAKQEQRMDVIARFTELVEQLRQKEKDLRAAKEPQFAEEIKAVEGQYLNEILNIRLKLDNADVMRKTQQEVDEWTARLEELQHQRGKAVMELKEKQEAEIQDIMNAARAEVRSQVQAYQAELDEKNQAEELLKQTKAQERNAAIMEQGAVVPMQNALRIAQKKSALIAKKQEIRMLENHIIKDIAGLAGKLAILNQLTLIVSNTADSQQGQDYYEYGVGDWHALRTPVIGINTIDLTDDMLKEMSVSRMDVKKEDVQSENKESGKEEI